MCRIAGYTGPPAPLSALLCDPPHSLYLQAYRPRLQHEGAVNVDGTGVAWWPPETGEQEPIRYVTDLPPWSDPNLLQLAGRLRGRMQLAAVRSATPGMPYGAAAVAPFTHGTLAVAHNGRIGGFRGPVGRRLLDLLPDDLFHAAGTLTDSVALFLTVVHHHRERPAAGLAGAVAAAVADAAKLVADAGETATLTVLAGDGERIVGARTAVRTPSHALFTLDGDAGRPGAALVAFEPLDDGTGWREVPDHHLVELTAGRVALLPIDMELRR
jgi:gamma-glutamyl hercynylcysteine S-oxide hydrolase